MRLPRGFKASAIAAGIKPSGKLDLGAVFSRTPLYWSLVSTEHSFRAPCVSRNRARFTSGQSVHGIVVNSGNANAATGEQGIWDNEDFAGLSTNALSAGRVQNILTASTGVVGKRLPIDHIRDTLPELAKSMHDTSDAFAEAIMTTDTMPKQVAVTMQGGARIVGVAKGSGMIHPNMATMLVFVMTDADIAQEKLREVWGDICANTFNQITVDGDTSPNDMALVFSSHEVTVDEGEFISALSAICERLTQKIARDGEGATKLLTVQVQGARNLEEARIASRAIAKSPLVKSAVHGNDPNWGRILTAIGASDAVSEMASLMIGLQGVTVFQGSPRPYDEKALSDAMKTEEVVIDVDLGIGNGAAKAWGCDLTAEYVRINADYTT